MAKKRSIIEVVSNEEILHKLLVEVQEHGCFSPSILTRELEVQSKRIYQVIDDLQKNQGIHFKYIEYKPTGSKAGGVPRIYYPEDPTPEQWARMHELLDERSMMPRTHGCLPPENVAWMSGVWGC